MKICKFFGIDIVVKFSFILFVGILCSVLDTKTAIIYFVSIFMHEIVHCVVGRVLGVKCSEIQVKFGGCMAVMPNLDYCDGVSESLVAFAGPGFNIIFAIIFGILSQMFYKWYYIFMGFAQINLLLGAFNLLPALPFDGGRIIRGMLTQKCPRIRATRICITISCITGGLCMLGFFYFVAIGKMPIMFALLPIIIFMSCKKEMNKCIRYNISTFSHKDKLKKARGINYIALKKTEPVATAINKFSMDKFNIINIIDETGKVCEIMTEIELYKALEN